MATRTSVGSGDWGTAGTWDTGVPADDDTVVIASGHTVVFNVDQSAFTTGIAGLTINGTLKLSRTAGTYELRIKGSTTINGSGTLDGGTAGDIVTSKHTIRLLSGNNRIDGANLTFSIYGVEPTNQYIRTTASEASGQTRIEVDTNVTGDLWAVGNTIYIVNSATGFDTETRVISAIGSNYIDISAGLTNAKNANSYVVLGARNITLISGSTYGLFYNFSYGKCTLTNVCFNAKSSSGGGGAIGIIATGGVFVSTSTMGMSGVGHKFNNSVLVTAVSYELSSFVNVVKDLVLNNCKLFGTAHVCDGYNVIATNCLFVGAKNSLRLHRNLSLNNCTFEGNTYDLYTVTGALYNQTLTSSTEHYLYTSAETDIVNCQSFDHDGVDGAIKAWCKGGVVTSQTSTKPTGYAQAYTHALESATYPVFWYLPFSLETGQSVSVEVQLRKTASMAYLPKAYLMASIGNPLAGATPVDSFTMTDSTDTWESDTFTLSNTTDYDQQYALWFVGQNANGSVYSAYKITTSGGSGGAVKIQPYSGAVKL